jgi:NAD-dependent dihydropyrimidine dehydrogenase PreA subunit
MISLLLADRCTACNVCVRICPANVFDAHPQGPPDIARPGDCQTCFHCELYCQADALYVAPECDQAVEVEAGAVLAGGTVGQYRRHSGWHEWAGTYPNEQWLMETVFRRAGEAAGKGDLPMVGTEGKMRTQQA